MDYMKSPNGTFATASLIFALLAIFSGQALAQTADHGARFKRLDNNGDGKISREETRGTAAEARFDLLDKNKDGFVAPDEVPRRLGAPESPGDAGETAMLVRQMNLCYTEVPSGVDANLLSLDIYAPKDAKNLPVMIYIHGGGWRTGDKKGVAAKPAYFTSRGFVFVSLNYRLVPEVDLFTQLQDSANAIGWAKEKITNYGGDPSRLHLIGHSAGAHHVAILSTNHRFLEKAGVSLGDLRSVVELDTQALDVPAMMEESENEVYRQAFGSESARWKELSPRHHVAEGKHIPPFFLVVADDRAPKLAQAAKFKEALDAAGIDCVIHEAPQHNHGSVNRAVGVPEELVTKAMERFHEAILGKSGGAGSDEAPGEGGHAFHWKPSLEFDLVSGKGPLPVNAMQLVAHDGMLFCGMATSFERDRYSGASSYIYKKAGADESWQLEADFGPDTSRVGQMFSARFETDGDGKPIPGGPKEVLVAFTMNIGGRSGTEALQVRVRDDETGVWRTHDLPTPRVPKANVREVWLHRDRVTGADLLFVAASPSPLGILIGSYDEEAPGGIRWQTEPEIVSKGRRGTGKWFGMATVNGVLLAADLDTVYRRQDGPEPTWTEVAAFPRGVGDEGGAGVRGLTAVPNPGDLTDWPEDEMLFLATRMKLWRLRVPDETTMEHERTVELDLCPWLSVELDDTVVFAEAAFNRLEPFVPETGASPVWPVGFQVVYEVPGKTLSNQDPDSFRLKDHAPFLLRDDRGCYTLDRIDSEKRLFLVRDFHPSPFPANPNTLYGCGYNGSYFKGSLGTAWIFRGRLHRHARTNAEQGEDTKPDHGPS